MERWNKKNWPESEMLNKKHMPTVKRTRPSRHASFSKTFFLCILLQLTNIFNHCISYKLWYTNCSITFTIQLIIPTMPLALHTYNIYVYRMFSQLHVRVTGTYFYQLSKTWGLLNFELLRFGLSFQQNKSFCEI